MFTQDHPILEKLADMPQVFKLVGSRFFETHSERSDWDFYFAYKEIRETMDLVTELEKLGFKHTEYGYTKDTDIHDVLTWVDEKMQLPSIDIICIERERCKKRLDMLKRMKNAGYKELYKVFKGQHEAFRQLCRIVGNDENQIHR